MKKEIFNAIKKEFAYTGILFLLMIGIFKIVFFNENLFIVIKIVASLFWLFVLPGFIAMFYWKEQMDFIERLIIGTVLSAGINGIVSYYLGLIGLHIQYHVFILPPVIMLIGAIILYRKHK